MVKYLVKVTPGWKNKEKLPTHYKLIHVLLDLNVPWLLCAHRLCPQINKGQGGNHYSSLSLLTTVPHLFTPVIGEVQNSLFLFSGISSATFLHRHGWIVFSADICIPIIHVLQFKNQDRGSINGSGKLLWVQKERETMTRKGLMERWGKGWENGYINSRLNMNDIN